MENISISNEHKIDKWLSYHHQHAPLLPYNFLRLATNRGVFFRGLTKTTNKNNRLIGELTDTLFYLKDSLTHKAKGSPAANGVPLITNEGKFLPVDLFSSKDNHNFIISGVAGAGKSFLANEIITTYLSEEKVVVRAIERMDAGCHQKLAARLGIGEQVLCLTSRPHSLNPFWGLNKKDFDSFKPVLEAFLKTLLAPVTGFTALEETLIQDALITGYEAGKDKMETSDVYDALALSNHKEANQLATRLEPYVVGAKSAWFNGVPDVDLTSRFVVFSVQHDYTNESAEFSEIVATLASMAIQKDFIQRQQTDKKVLLVDTATPATEVLDVLFEQAPALNASIGALYQTFNEVSPSIVGRSAWKFVLRQATSSIEHALENGFFRVQRDDFNENLGGFTVSQPVDGVGISELYVEGEDISLYAKHLADPFAYKLFK